MASHSHQPDFSRTGSRAIPLPLTAASLPRGWERRTGRAGGGDGDGILAARHGAQPLCIEPKASGTYRIVLGLVRFPGTFCEAEVKVGDSGYWRHIRPVHFINDHDGGLQRLELDPHQFGSGDRIRIRPIERHASWCGLASIHLEPVTDEAPVWHKTNVGAVCDTHGMFARGPVASVEEIEGLLHPFVASDVDRVCWGTGAGSFRMLYFSRVLPYFGEGKSSMANESNSRVANTLQQLRRQGIDPLDVAIAFCANHNMELWANDRICHAFAPGSYDDDFAAPFYLDNPHLRTLTDDGSRGATLSLAHREYQDLKIALYCEWAERGVSGIYIDLLRKPGLLGRDAPLVDAFRRQMGRDPEKQDFNDLPWLHIRAACVTEFMTRVRAALDGVGARQGRRIPLAVQGFAGRSYRHNRMIDENLRQGYDIGAWAKAGLIDIYAPSTGRHYQPTDLSHHKTYLADSNCQLWGCLGQHHDSLFADDYNHEIYFGNNPDKTITPIADLDPLRILRAAAECYTQGAEGVFLWEAGETPHCPARWNSLRKLGHRDQLLQQFGPDIGPFDGSLHLKHG